MNLNAVKVGNVVNISIDGKLQKKNCGSVKEADELFRLILKAKQDPSEENIKAVRCSLNEKLRVALQLGLEILEVDPETGLVYLAGFNTPVPKTLVEIMKEYKENDYPMDVIVNFWTLLMLNPDERIREVLFDFISTHDFVLTDEGYMVVYKAVYRVETEGQKESNDFAEFLNKKYLHVKKTWKCSPNKYIVYKDVETKEMSITKKVTADKWDEKAKGVEVLGKLGDLHDSIFNGDDTAARENNVPVYTDMHSQKMRIELGTPVDMKRPLCDSNFRKDCSNGLHVGATKYVEKFANWHSGENRSILVCYVNPANVVAVPEHDHSKMRVCEYFPFAIAEWDGKNIDIIEQAYFESDYSEYEEKELEKLVEKVKANQLPIEKAQNCADETRSMSELQKIIETRMVNLK